MSDDERLSDIDRHSLRILARSSKTSSSSTRLAERLERAAESGLRLDYERAEQTFDSLPAEDRVLISAKAEKQAVTERDLLDRRKRVAPERVRKPAAAESTAAGDDQPLQWQPIFEPAGVKTETPPPPPRKRKAAAKPPAAAGEDDDVGISWKLAIPGNPKKKGAGRGAKAPAPQAAPEPADDWEDDQKDWNWREIPEDPVLSRGRKKNGAVDPVEELRRQMLGLDAKYDKR